MHRAPTLLAGLLACVLALAGCDSVGGEGSPDAEPPATAAEPEEPAGLEPGGAKPPEPPAGDAPEEPAPAAGPGDAAREPAGSGRGLRLVRVASGLDSPVHLAAPRSEPGRLYVVEQAGRIRVIRGGRVLPQPFLDIRHLVSSGGERGLLSVAFHPRYARNRLFYVNYTDRGGDTRVVEYRARPGRSPIRRRQLLFVAQPFSNHNGGQLAFAPNGHLLVGMGDGGGAGDPGGRAQDLSTRLGKLLRLNVNRRDARWRLVAYGLRNPWRFSFDRATGDLYIADVGQSSREEINYLPRRSPGLENFGWDVFEGSIRFENKQPNPRGRLVGPIAEYDHSQGCSVTGGFVYRGSRVAAAARGRYFYGDYCSGRIWSLVVRDGRATDVRRHSFRVERLTSFGENARGELFLVSHGGTIFRLAGR